MKTIEEKAKAYDEALSKVANCSTDKYGCLIGMKPSDLFPELAESGDEKIRKEIKDFFSRIMLGQENFLKEDCSPYPEGGGLIPRHPHSFFISKPLPTFYTNKGGAFISNEATAFISNEVLTT